MNKKLSDLNVNDTFTFVGDRTNTVRVVTRKALVQDGMAVIETTGPTGSWPERITKPALTSVCVWS